MKIPRMLTLALMGLLVAQEAANTSFAQDEPVPTGGTTRVEARDRGRTGRGRNEGEEQARTSQGVPLGAGAGALLTRPEVLEELKVKDAQKQAIDRIIAEQSRNRRRGNDRRPQVRNTENDEETETVTSPEDEAEAAVTKPLDAKQKLRLHQLVLRNLGAQALLRPEVINRLKMSEEQVMQIHEVFGEAEEGMNAEQQAFLQQQQQTEFDTPVFVNDDGSIEAVPVQRPNVVQRTPAQALAQAKSWDDQAAATQMRAAGEILRKSQRQSFDAMLGDPFDMSRLRKPYNREEAAKLTAAKAKSETKAATPAADTKKAAPATKPARKSLRDRRKSSSADN